MFITSFLGPCKIIRAIGAITSSRTPQLRSVNPNVKIMNTTTSNL